MAKPKILTYKHYDPLDNYPIGSIYMSLDPTNPSSLFGGIWEQNSGMDSRESVNIIGNNENNASRQHFLGVLLQRDYRKDLVTRKRKWCQLVFLFCTPDPVLFGYSKTYTTM